MLNTFVRNFLAAWKIPRWRAALLIAAVSDAIGFGVVLFVPLQWAVDVLTAGALLWVLGLRWAIVPAVAVEVVPGLQLFPAWTLFVLAMAGTDNTSSMVVGKSDATHDPRSLTSKE